MPDSIYPDPFAFVEDKLLHLPPRDLLEWEQEDIPDGPGAYIFVADRKKFLYPNGESPVFYIGQAVNLRQRLYRHKKVIMQAGGKRPHPIYRPVTEFAATHSPRAGGRNRGNE